MKLNEEQIRKCLDFFEENWESDRTYEGEVQIGHNLFAWIAGTKLVCVFSKDSDGDEDEYMDIQNSGEVEARLRSLEADLLRQEDARYRDYADTLDGLDSWLRSQGNYGW